jgi:hypothetical protein
MNMKSGLVFSLCALALAAYCGQAQAAVNMSLNLHYTDPADPSEGGTFQLVAKTDSPNGISALNAYLSNINTAGLVYGNGTTITATTLGAITNTGAVVFQTPVTGGFNLLYGQDTANGPVVKNVGRGNGTPGNVTPDVFKNNAWNNVALLVSGTFGATRPAFISAGANSSDANVFANANTVTPLASGDVIAAGTVTTIVRGDSVATDGLKSGDANRDNVVNSDDFNILALNFGGSGKTWDQGDFNDSGTVTSDDFNLLALNFGQSRPAPSVAAASAVPEPASLGLLAVSALGMFALRRRS